MKEVELLSPAGTYECFIAAVCAGADAVYLGLDKFGARASAGNFTIEELYRALDIAHILGKKIYLTVNTLFKERELGELYDFLKGPYEHGIDGIIVQDIGVVSYVRRHFPLLDVHASTQMTITDVEGVEFAKHLGITRVVPARELSLSEIKNIHDRTGMELECFCHGALCYAYSGKCLFSSFLGGRSGNRGRCAQPCRLQYNDKYMLSMKDLYTLREIPAFIESGVYSFKIEGRMKSPDYVYGVTSIYRKYIDLYNQGKQYKVDKDDENRLLSLYTRAGNCDGYLKHKNGKNMITWSSPSYNSKAIDVKNTFTEKSIQMLAIAMKADIRRDEKISLALKVDDKDSLLYGREFLYESDVIPQQAKTNALTKELIYKQFSKTGNTLFRVSSGDINIEDGLFISNGQLNAIRREALEAFTDMLLGKFYRSCDDKAVTEDKFISEIENVSTNEPCVNVSVNTISQFKTLIKYIIEGNNYISGVMLSLNIARRMVDDIELSRQIKELAHNNRNISIYLRLPYIVRDNYNLCSSNRIQSDIKYIQAALHRICDCRISGYYISNYESLELLKNNIDECKIIGDIHMYATNSEAFCKLKELGISKTTVPVELNKAEVIERRVLGEELIIYGKIPMMISAQCVKCNLDKCEQSENGHSQSITDRKNAKLSVFSDCSECTNIIYNSVPISIIGEREVIDLIKPSSLRIMFTDESGSTMINILDRAKRIIENHDFSINELCDEYTKGHIKKGVL